MIQLLLDTNVFLWYFWGSPRIEPVRELIESEEADVFVSAASFWEIAIKTRAGKLNANMDELRFFAKKYSFLELPITSACLSAYAGLPALHKDPFDHILLAQAITGPMRLVSGDAFLAAYSSLVITV